MAYVNVREWSPDQVTEWLRGLDNVILPYVNSFLNNEVKGHQLLCLRSDDLEHLGVYTLGHQELILEAVEQLRNFHYELDRENLQLLALRLSCAARSLFKELFLAEDTSKIETQTMADVANIISTIKPLVCWLDRAPFSGQSDYYDRKTKLLQLSLEMATCAQRDRFVEQPIDKIRTSCYSLAKLADNIIQEISDPMLLQPSSLDLATLKKKENELGFSLMPTFHGIHQIAEIKFTSPAHTNNKLEEGDEIVQINYQTVVGWQRKKVLGLFHESPPDIVLTLKKRPRHTKVYGQIYMKPYRLPSKKRQTPYSRWNDNLPSPRPELLTIPDFEMPVPRLPPIIQVQPLESESSSDSEPPDSPLESQGRVYPLKPRPVLQRRNTITGASPTNKRPLQAIEQLWNELKHQAAYKHSSSTYIETDTYKRESVYLRDKSVSCGHGLELTQRPETYPKKFDKTMLIQQNNNKSDATNKKKVNFDENKIIFEEPPGCVSCVSSASSVSICDKVNNTIEKSISVNSLSSLSKSDEPIKFIDETVDEMYDRSNMNATEWKNEIIEEIIDNIQMKKSVIGNVNPPPSPQIRVIKKPPEIPAKPDVLKKPAVPPRNFSTRITTTTTTMTTIRGRLDKSYSTPAYDTTQEIHSEKIVLNTPRAPEILITSPPEVVIETMLHDIRNPYTEIKEDVDEDHNQKYLMKSVECPPEPPPRTIFSSETVGKLKHFEPKCVSTPTPISKTATIEFCGEAKVSPTNSVVRAMMNTKNKCAKKKNTLLAKRRKVSVKDLMPCDIQGCLYQRLRNKHTQHFHWEKRWFVLLGSCLYGFKTKDALKAECLIFLTGFTVAIAHEVKSRLNAFTVYHTGTAFYFSAENSETMCSWVELITAATLHLHLHSDASKPFSDSALFSESDDSESEKGKTTEGTKEKVEVVGGRKFGSLKKFTSSKKSSDTVPANESTSLDRKYLRFFNNSSSKTSKNQLPVPTPQFRSYRKVVPSNLVVNQQTKKPETPKSPEIHHGDNTSINTTSTTSSTSSSSKNKFTSKVKPKPINYIHASNPSLCDINDYRFQSFYSKTRQFNQRSENLTGFVTLEQFMLNRQEEERRQNLLFGGGKTKTDDIQINPNSIQPDVVYGEIRNQYSGDSRTFDSKGKVAVAVTKNLYCYEEKAELEELVSDVKVTEPYALQYADKKCLRSAADKPYELIYCPQKVNDVQFAQNRTLDSSGSTDNNSNNQNQNQNQNRNRNRNQSRNEDENKSKLMRQHSLNSGKSSVVFKRGECPEKFWLDSLRRTDRNRLKPVAQYTPFTSAATKGCNPKFAFELNLDEQVNRTATPTTKFKGFFGGSSSSSSNSGGGGGGGGGDKKEKTLLGSPRLHRALFRKPNHNHNQNQNQNQMESDWSSSSETSPPLLSTSITTTTTTTTTSTTTQVNPISNPCRPNLNILISSPPDDYPGLEYPPVFEPETYSLANPSCSLTLLRKQQK